MSDPTTKDGRSALRALAFRAGNDFSEAMSPEVLTALLDRIDSLEAERLTLHHKAGDALHSLRALLDGESATVIDRGRYWGLHEALRAGEPLKVQP